MTEQETDLITLTADIVGAHVAHNNVPTGDIAALIQSVHTALKGLGQPPEPVVEKQEPAVSIRSSVKPDHIVCLEDGKKLKMLKRYLRTNYDMSPDEYRRKWNLPSDYPMVAPNYAEKRRTLAHSIGLGRKSVEPRRRRPSRAGEPKRPKRSRPAPSARRSQAEAAPPRRPRKRRRRSAAASPRRKRTQKADGR